MNYSFLTRVREEEVDGTGPWVWPYEDRDGWYGPGLHFKDIKDAILAHTKIHDTIVQAGGCAGMYPRLWSKYFKEVYTFEPDPLNFYCLTQNCQVNNIHKFQAAVGDQQSSVWLQRDASGTNCGYHKIERGSTQGTITVQQMRIDDLALKRCDVIQLDIEHYELYALHGAWMTISQFHPTICVEDWSQPILDFLGKANYYKVAQLAMDSVFVWAG